jgi:hypothetical protein
LFDIINITYFDNKVNTFLINNSFIFYLIKIQRVTENENARPGRGMGRAGHCEVPRYSKQQRQHNITAAL